MGVGEVSVVGGFCFAALVFFDIGAGENPVAAEGRETFADVALKRGITPRTGAIVNVDGGVFFDAAVGKVSAGGVLGVGKADLAYGDSHAGMDFSFDVDAGGIGKNGGVFGEGFELGGVVDVFHEVAGVIASLGGVFGGEAVVVVVVW